MAKLANNSEIAIQYYEKALDLWPTYEHAMNNLGNVYKNLGKYEPRSKWKHAKNSRTNLRKLD